MEAGGVTLIEAPTGVGKSLAYLVPAARWAIESGARVVISTNTKNLQDQLLLHDIPIVSELIGSGIKATVLKGRSNYVCMRRWRLLQSGQIELPLNGDREETASAVGAWIGSTSTGDLGEFDLYGDPGARRLIELVRVEEGTCDPGRCSVEEECFVRRLRRRAWKSHLVCVNHALLAGQLLGRWDVLPPFDVMVIDECHNVPRVARDQLGVRVGSAAFNKALSGLIGKIASLGPLKGKARSAAEGRRGVAAAAREAGGRAEELFDGVRGAVARSGGRGAVRYRGSGELGDMVMELGAPVLSACIGLAESLRGVLPAASGAPEVLEEIESELASWTRTCDDLEKLLNPADAEGAFWLDRSPALRWAPVDVAGHIGPAVDAACEAVVLTSATITVGKSFDYFRSTMGLTSEHSSEPRCVSVESTFDLESSVLFLVPGDGPDPRESGFGDYVAEAVRRILECTGKKTLALFTSHSMLREVRAALDGGVGGAAVLAQGVDGGRTELTRAFKSGSRGALLGTASFWEGVDFPGEEAEVLLIARLPFPAPSEPVVEARCESLESEGIDPFWSYLLPEAVVRLRQGFGRLIRSRADRGVVVILDPRVVRASYARAFLGSLPVQPRIMDGVESAASAAADWFSEVRDNAREDKSA